MSEAMKTAKCTVCGYTGATFEETGACMACSAETEELEEIHRTVEGTTDRIQVPGGWLYRTFYVAVNASGCSVATTFVPHPPEKAKPGRVLNRGQAGRLTAGHDGGS